MTDMTCEQVQDSITEYALGILPDDERRGLTTHVLGCLECRRELEEIRDIGDRLLDLVPDAEPTLGFDHAVLARINPKAEARPDRRAHRSHWAHPSRRIISGLVAAAAIVAAVVIPLSLTSNHHSSQPAELTASLQESGRSVGSVDVSGHPLWVYMNVHGEKPGGTVTCQLIHQNGTFVTVGTFQLVDGSGSWGAPVAGATSQYVGARLLSPSGSVVAQAIF
jgi:anti-sigma-K factor RskA